MVDHPCLHIHCCCSILYAPNSKWTDVYWHPLNRAYWTVLYVLMAFAIVYWRIGVPMVRSLKVNLRVEKVIVEGLGVISVIMKGRNLHKLGAQGGQFFGWRFLTGGHSLMSHPYSLSAAPTEHLMCITVKDLGDYSHS